MGPPPDKQPLSFGLEQDEGNVCRTKVRHPPGDTYNHANCLPDGRERIQVLVDCPYGLRKRPSEAAEKSRNREFNGLGEITDPGP